MLFLKFNLTSHGMIVIHFKVNAIMYEQKKGILLRMLCMKRIKSP